MKQRRKIPAGYLRDMQFRRSHIPSVPRAATYSCSLTTRSPRKKTASTQTDKYFSQFENWFDSGRTSRGELAFDEETTKTYCMALEFVNSFHCYMNEKLGEKYRECADTKPEGDAFFKLPEVPNYAAIFFMLLEKTKGPKSASNEEYVLERKTNNLEHELETKKCPTELSERVVLERKETLEETKTIEQEALTIVSHLKDDDSVSCSTSKKSCNVHSRASGEDPEQKKESTTEETCDTVSNNQKMENGR